MTIGTVPTQMVSQAFIDPLQIPVKNADVKYRAGSPSYNGTGAWTWERGTPGLYTGSSLYAVPGAIQAGKPADVSGRCYVDVPLSPYAISLVATGTYQLQPTIRSYTLSGTTDEILTHVLFMDGSGDFIGGRGKGSARNTWSTGQGAWSLLWVPPDTETIRIELAGYRFTNAEAYIEYVKLALVQHSTDQCEFIFGNRDSQTIVDTFTLVSGSGWSTTSTWIGAYLYPGIGMWAQPVCIMYKDIMVSSLSAKAQTEIGLGNAQLTATFYYATDNISGTGDATKTRIQCNNGVTNLLSVGFTSYVGKDPDGTAYSYTGTVPTTTDRFRVYYDGDKVGSGNNEVLVSNFFGVLQYPVA